MKKLVALFLTLAIAMSFATIPAFAEESDYPEGAVMHTIEVDVPAGETIGQNFFGGGVSPLMWDQDDYDVGYGVTTYTPKFYPEHRYLAYEISATTSSGGTINECYSVDLVIGVTANVAGMTKYVNGTTYKLDWIDVNTSIRYQFKILNSTSTAIKVRITYYTWP